MSATLTEADAPPRPPKKSKRKALSDVPRPAGSKKRRFPVAPWLLLAPSIVLLGIMVGYPTIAMIVQSFTDLQIKNKMLDIPANFVGLENFIGIIAKGDFPAVLGRSLALMVVLTILNMAGGMLIGMLMMRLGRAWRTAVSVALLIAWAMPPLAATIVWGWIFDTEYGLMNHVMTLLTGDRWYGHSWLANSWSFTGVLIIIIVWQSIPFVAFTFYAGLGQIPGEVLEAAQLDGAGAVKRYRYIIAPYMRNVVTAVLVLQIIWNLRIFTQVYALQQQGGIVSETNVLPTLIFRQGLGDFGVTAAIGVILLILLMGLSYFNVRRTLKSEELA
ncbi:carbohydrate ABC transporter permease [Agromyces archimandritae]|uniref:Sugar ABC transporter permease n=1 Tax=Agromyces archimandritae TaxID=2781962 RepID=A0A975FJZ7_9MICO|nr:sugar ABC transporter permease [Agromyces archimandritae]QTX03930.1 sugar ABC transporter permease [Agromyces archimandritae]